MIILSDKQSNLLVRQLINACNGKKLLPFAKKWLKETNYNARSNDNVKDDTSTLSWDYFVGTYHFSGWLGWMNYRYNNYIEHNLKSFGPDEQKLHIDNFLYEAKIRNRVLRGLNINKYRLKYLSLDDHYRRKYKRHTEYMYGRNFTEALNCFMKPCMGRGWSKYPHWHGITKINSMKMVSNKVDYLAFLNKDIVIPYMREKLSLFPMSGLNAHVFVNIVV